MAYTSGKHAKFISDRSGFAYPYSERIKEWTGAVVHMSEYEAKHPQLEPNVVGDDPQALKEARPDRTETAVIRLLRPNCFKSGAIGSAVITITEPSHGRSTNDAVRFRKVVGFDGFTKTTLELSTGYVITVLDENTYTITVTGESATAGDIRGGGAHATIDQGTATPSPSPTISKFDSTSITLDSATKTFDEG
jgi:hypothetical protein|tara:strand:+ start:3500 stop:4078 length:579 start_codon:yes stop_codon:yes gene_type:complete